MFESCHGYYFSPITWKANVNARLSPGWVRASFCALEVAPLLLAAVSQQSRFPGVAHCGGARLQHTISIWYSAHPFHTQTCFVSSVAGDLFWHYPWHILIIPDEEWTQWTAFPLFHSFSTRLLLAAIIQSTQECAWIHPGIQSSEENTTGGRRKHCSASARALENA